MATARSFQDMLNEYLPNRLLKEELIKRSFLLQNVEKDNNWKGGKLIVPFRGNQANSVKFGSLTAANDISEADYVRGSIDDYTEVWGSLIFNQTDLYQHQDARRPEDSFLRVLPDQIDEHMEYMKEVVSGQMLNDVSFASVASGGDTNAATGRFIVDRIEKFYLNQKVILDDDDSAVVEVYVIAIDQNESQVTLSLTRGGAAADLSAYTVAQNAKFYQDGVFDGTTTNNFISLRRAFLTAANGGDANIHGVSKLAFPHLQAINIDGSGVTATNILDRIFDGYRDVRRKAKGKADKVLMSYKNLGSVMKLIEVQKGGFKVTPTTEKASIYGFTEIEITSVTNEKLVFVGIQEMDDDVIMYVDMSGMTFRTNGMFRKRQAPDGKEYFEVRNTSGYQYIVDTCLYGELEIRYPGHNGILYGINY